MVGIALLTLGIVLLGVFIISLKQNQEFLLWWVILPLVCSIVCIVAGIVSFIL